MTKLVRCGINFYADVDNKKAVNDRDALQNTKLMEHYTHLLGQLQYEGAGIWSRFNIMFGINVSLFGLETVLFNSICQTSEYLTFIIAFGGLSFSIWSIYVMQRLWSYHEHWKNMLCEAEKAFPDEYVKLFTKIPSNLKREKKSWELWLKSYTQPFFAILSLIWLLIMVLNHAIYTDMLNKENIIHHVGVVKIQQNENLKNNEDEKDDGFDYCDYYYNTEIGGDIVETHPVEDDAVHVGILLGEPSKAIRPIRMLNELDSAFFCPITELGSEYRADYDRWEYIHHTYLMDDAADIRILEGESFVLLDMDECLRLENLAPHHKLFLLKYRAGLCKIDVREQSKKMFDEITVRDLIRVESVGDVKNYSLLEAGTGFVIGEDTTLSASIPAVEAAKYIGFLQFVPKVLRGNHYHFRKVEYMLILQGRMHATFQKYDDSEAVIEEIWEKGDLVRTLPGCVHTLTALGESNVLTIEFSPQPYVARDVLMNDKK